MTVYIDADSIMYRACHISSRADDALLEAQAIELDSDDDDIDLEESIEPDNLEEARRIFHSMVNLIFREVQKGYNVEDEPKLVITVKSSTGLAPNFRYEVMEGVTDEEVKGYKHNRKDKPVPEGLTELYDYVYNLDNCICESGVEADDVCVYYGRQGNIVCALDKDVLGSLEYAYNYNRNEWSERTAEEIAIFPYIQTITGDTGDGLRGVYRVGIKGAEKLVKESMSDYDKWVAVVTAYYTKGQTLEEAIATMRCVRMDEWTPEKGLVLWTPPKKESK